MVMRDILFRGKTVDNSGWVEGEYMGIEIHIKTSYPFEWWGYEVIPESVGQFTGLTDKNEVKIFDGDVLQNEDGDEFCNTLIFWDKDLSSWSDCRDFDGDSFRAHFLDMIWTKDCEVVWNIFENPY